MRTATLARVKEGINLKTWKPFFYVEVRQTAKTRWCRLVGQGKWLRHRSKTAAEKEAVEMQGRLLARGQL